MRMIDGDALLNGFDVRKVTEYDESGCGFDYKAVPVEAIKTAPTIDAEPVRHGEWLLRHVGHGHYWECSACHTNPCIYVTSNTKFCPNCGAKMDLEVSDGKAKTD